MFTVAIFLFSLFNLIDDHFYIVLKSQHLFVDFDLISEVGYHELELSVAVIKEPLIILNLLIYKVRLLVKGL